MRPHSLLTKFFILLVVAGCVFVFFIVAFIERIPTVTNFNECKEAGYSITEGAPQQCTSLLGDVYTEEVATTDVDTEPKVARYVHFNEVTTLAVGEEINVSDDLVVRLASISDSRCQPNTECIWAGELSPIFLISELGLTAEQAEVRMGTMNSTLVDVQGYSISLSEATEFSATITITKTFSGSSNTARTEGGYVTGRVHIGPICPVERVDTPCTVPSIVYTSRSIVVYEIDQKTVLTKTKLSEHGEYSISLPVGAYWLQVEPAGIGPGELQKIEIVSQETTTLDFDVDTGIR